MLGQKMRMYIVDRADDMIIINSHKIYPNKIKMQIIENTSITDCSVVKLTINNNLIGCLYVNRTNVIFDIKIVNQGFYVL